MRSVALFAGEHTRHACGLRCPAATNFFPATAFCRRNPVTA
jgi:hypothetical protein